jgi:hypothetical protein
MMMRWRFDETKKKLHELELKIDKVKQMVDKYANKIKEYE